MIQRWDVNGLFFTSVFRQCLLNWKAERHISSFDISREGSQPLTVMLARVAERNWHVAVDLRHEIAGGVSDRLEVFSNTCRNY